MRPRLEGALVRIVLASSNAGKLRELAVLLAPFGFDVFPQGDFGVESPEETGKTFAENALLKARHAASIANLPAVADDSGIEVDALGGRPGVHSARYAGVGASDQDNLHKLLGELQGVPPEKRTARYQCVIAFLTSAADPNPLVASGTWEGTLTSEARGVGGFGYDPIFLPLGLDRTAAQLDLGEKNVVSHRGQALRALVALLRQRHGQVG
jgi:XTP/dITP diphosphohydrolase